MSTRNGFGTMYYGWRHADDGTATATKWITLLWIPVLPVRRDRVRVLAQDAPRVRSVLGGIGGVSQTNVAHYELIEPLAISFSEVLLTWVNTVLGPAALIVMPMMLVFAVLMLPAQLLHLESYRVAQFVSFISIFQVAHVFSIVLRRSRGERVSWLGRVVPKRDREARQRGPTPVALPDRRGR